MNTNIKVSKQQHKFLIKMLQHWQQEALLDERQCKELLNSTTVRGFDWQTLARYAFFVALFCILHQVFSTSSGIYDPQLCSRYSLLKLYVAR